MVNPLAGLIGERSDIRDADLDHLDDLDCLDYLGYLGYLDNLDDLANLDALFSRGDLQGIAGKGGFRYASNTSATPNVRWSPDWPPKADTKTGTYELVPEGDPRFKPRLQPGTQTDRKQDPALKGPTGFASLHEPVRPFRPRCILKIAVTQGEPWALTVGAFSAARGTDYSEIAMPLEHRKCQ